MTTRKERNRGTLYASTIFFLLHTLVLSVNQGEEKLWKQVPTSGIDFAKMDLLYIDFVCLFVCLFV